MLEVDLECQKALHFGSVRQLAWAMQSRDSVISLQKSSAKSGFGCNAGNGVFFFS